MTIIPVTPIYIGSLEVLILKPLYTVFMNRYIMRKQNIDPRPEDNTDKANTITSELIRCPFDLLLKYK